MSEDAPGLVGIPCGEQARWTEFARCLTFLRRPPGTRLAFNQGTYIQASRNDLVSEMLSDPESQWLLMLDDDHVFAPDLLIQLLAHEVDVVGALALARKPPYFICAFEATDSRSGVSRGLSIRDVPFALQEVAAVGTGAILIRRHVLEAIEPPWFEVSFDERGRNVSEDVTFCEKARGAGFHVYLDGAQSIGHLTGVSLRLAELPDGGRGVQIVLGPDDVIAIPVEQIEELELPDRQ